MQTICQLRDQNQVTVQFRGRPVRVLHPFLCGFCRLGTSPGSQRVCPQIARDGGGSGPPRRTPHSVLRARPVPGPSGSSHWPKLGHPSFLNQLLWPSEGSSGLDLRVSAPITGQRRGYQHRPRPVRALPGDRSPNPDLHHGFLWRRKGRWGVSLIGPSVLPGRLEEPADGVFCPLHARHPVHVCETEVTPR